MEKPAPTDLPILDPIRRRWSPRAFSGRAVPKESLATIFEAARWAPSCYNEQPWRYLVATSDHPEAHGRAASLLGEGNRWAAKAPVLVISLARLAFVRSGEANIHAWHDVGAASENMFLQATQLGLAMHEMAGFDRIRAREVYAVPDGWECVAMIAIGHPGSADDLAEPQRTKETAPRVRKPLSEIISGSRFGEPFDLG
jgi:nitroreductase